MKVSYNNLQTYFAKPLPPVYELADLITTHVWEVDEIAQNGSDYILDLKVLPDRNYPGFGDKDVAWEVASILNWPAEGVPSPEMGNSIIFTTKQINNLLGLALSDQEILALLKRAHIEVESGGEGDYVAAPPGSRKDLHIVEDLADEVGRRQKFCVGDSLGGFISRYWKAGISSLGQDSFRRKSVDFLWTRSFRSKKNKENTGKSPFHE
jgi:hypothetical protein